jgi:hypothetical protein
MVPVLQFLVGVAGEAEKNFPLVSSCCKLLAIFLEISENSLPDVWLR